MGRVPADSAERQPLRLLWLIDSLTLGGAESLVLPFSRALDRSQVDLRVCCLKSIAGNPIEERLRDAGIPVINLGARNLRDLAAFRRLVALLRQQQIQIVHAHLTYAVIWGVLACRLAKLPIVATLHVGPTTAGGLQRDSIREWLMIRFLRWRRATTLAVSDSVRKAFIEKYRLPPHRIQVLHNAVKVVTFERRNPERAIQLKQQFRFPEDATVLITVAVLRALKGIDTLLGALPAVLRAAPEVRLLVAGEGPMREQWMGLATQLGVDHAVHWAGYRQDVPALLAGSDLFVLPSRDDAFPTVLLEAMAAELPIIATNVGGIPEIVDSPAVGVLVPPRDPEALAEAITRLLQADKTRQGMAEAARRRVTAQFSTQRWMDRLMTVYRQAAGQPTGSLRIAVVEFAGKGGLIHYAFQLCRAMAREGAEVTLLTDEHYELDGVEHPFRLRKIFRLWDPKPDAGTGRRGDAVSPMRRVRRAILYYRAWRDLASHLESEKYDVVQLGDIRFATDLLALKLVRRRTRILADICHNVRRFSAGGRFTAASATNAAYGRIYRLFDHIFVHYDVNRAAFHAGFPSSSGKVTVIVHGNQELFAELRAPLRTADRLRSELGLLPGEEVVLFFGTLSAYKGIDLLLEAFVAVAPRHPRSRLVIAGFALPDFDVNRHLALAHGLGMSERVRIVARYIDSSEVAAWMELASVVVFPYREIYQSGALHVAQTFGAPIVATRVGATADVIEHGVTGLLVSAGDAKALAEAISRLLGDRDLARRLGDAGRAAAQQVFGWRGIACQILDAYEQRLESGRS